MGMNLYLVLILLILMYIGFQVYDTEKAVHPPGQSRPKLKDCALHSSAIYPLHPVGEGVLDSTASLVSALLPKATACCIAAK